MNNCLILLTNYYPYYKGEEYLETEIKYLSKKFKKIYIIATMVSKDMVQTRPLPENVYPLVVGLKHSIFGKLKMLLHQFNSISRKKNITLLETKNILNKFYSYYFESRAMEIYKVTKSLLDKNCNFKNYYSITIYSYWLYVTARVAVELKNNYFNGRKVYAISRAHRYDLYVNESPLKFLPERKFLINNLDFVFPCSQDGVDYLTNNFPEQKNKIKLSRLGTLAPDIAGKTTNEKLYIVSCSVIRKVKRLDLLIDALVELEKRNIPFFWTHIGDGPEFKNIKRIAKKKLREENYQFTGFKKNQDVIKWYNENSTTFFINVSSSEGVPVSIMEALSMGVPVIATDVGGTKEIVDNEKNGFLLERDCNSDQIFNYILKFRKMSSCCYSTMCKNAFEIWNLRCNAEIIYSNFACDLTSLNLEIEDR
ncbi:glycosyltransferase [Heyndrickxia coagulans]|uniref:glycosyltransferase n=1 Tax=Heyndrickxia coagulans TaxID=1398 RepID=UPI000D7304A0|nr:glycosyltransferase [Heyndrickxia coagulans]AWP35948.1 glycosyl transferase family 1 [Heyndrickxia coagulans]QDI61446.1 glycosyltransferase [Heyndrickxia coagulans]